MNKHTYKIIGSKSNNKTSLIKQFRAANFTVSTDKKNISTIQSYPTEAIVNMAKAGELVDVCQWHGKNTRKVCGAKSVARDTSTSAIKARVQDEVDALVKPIVKRLYRQAKSSWAGGNTTVTITIDSRPCAWGDSQRRWSNNGKWQGYDANLHVSVMYDYRRTIASVPGLIDAGGMLTTHAKRVSPDCWKASWVVQSRGFDINFESGYIVRSVEGEWIHGKTEKSARKLATQRDEQARIDQREALTKIIGTQDGSYFSKNLDIVVTLEDSRSAGNCQTGTQNWINRYFPGRKSATIREIIAADPTNNRALLACLEAFRRTQNETIVA